MPDTTSRLALAQPLGTDEPSELRVSIAANATTLDAAVIVTEGTLADRPAGSYVGRTYYATDTALWYFYTGAAWQAVTFGAMAPVGTVQQFAGATISADPDGVTRWHVCDGSALSRTTYSALFAALSTTWGAGDGSTTFNIPDLRGRVAVGSGAGSGLTSRTLAQEGGEENHTLSVAELASHAHGVSDPGHAHAISDPGHAHDSGLGSSTDWNAGSGNWTGYGVGHDDTTVNATGIGIYAADTGVSVQDAGGGAAHNNMPPFAVVTHIVKIL